MPAPTAYFEWHEQPGYCRDLTRHFPPGAMVLEIGCATAQRWVWDDDTHRRPLTRRSFRLRFADQGFAVRRADHESVTAGAGILSRHTKRKPPARARGGGVAADRPAQRVDRRAAPAGVVTRAARLTP